MAIKTGTNQSDRLRDNFVIGFNGRPVDLNTDDFVTALAGSDTIELHNGNDTADGGIGNDEIFDLAGGNDVMFGRDGFDTFFAGSGENEINGGGIFNLRGREVDGDLVTYETSSVEVVVNLAAGTGQGDGNDRLIDIEHIDGSLVGDIISGDGQSNRLSGADGDDSLSGGGGEDSLNGGNGDDSLSGNGGDDSLDGGAGIDILQGGRGRDSMRGGDDADTFLYRSTGESRANAGIDLITDFAAGEDTIDLSAIDANRHKSGNQAFKLVDEHKSKAAGQVEATFDADRDVTVIEAYTNKDNTADFVIELTGNVDLSKGDFVL